MTKIFWRIIALASKIWAILKARAEIFQKFRSLYGQWSFNKNFPNQKKQEPSNQQKGNKSSLEILYFIAQCILTKFRNSEKATQIWPIFHFLHDNT